MGRKQTIIKPPSKSFSNLDLTEYDKDIDLLEELIREEMYEKSEQSLYSFFINFWDTFDPQPLVNNWHIQCLCEHIQAALERKIRRLIINIAPRSSKSTTSSITCPPWWWLKHPDEKFWLVSHSEKLYAQNIGYARKIIDHPTYKNRWCNPKEEERFRFQLQGVDRVTRVENSEGGYLLGGSPGAKVLGMGYSVAILDDVLDSQESNSKEAVDNVNSWYTQTFLNRTNDVNNDVIILVMQRLCECFLPSTLVKTDSGLKEIQYLTYQDKVYTSNNKYEPILNISKKDVNPEIIQIKPIGIPTLLQVTPKHEVKTFDIETNNYIWKEARNITLKDKLVLPIRNKQKDINVFDLWGSDLTRKNSKTKYTGNAKGYTKNNPLLTKQNIIDAFTVCGNHIQKVAKYLHISRNTISNYLKYYELDYLSNKFNLLSKEALLTKEFWRVVGYWVAEGWLQNNLVGFVFNSKETEYLDFIYTFCNKYNIPCSIKPHPIDNYTKIYFSSKQFADFLRTHFKELAENKSIPDWLFDLEDSYIKEFLLGYIQGDGSIRQTRTSIATVSKNLADGVFNLFLRLNIPCYQTKTIRNKENNLDIYEVHISNYYIKEWVYKQDKPITELNSVKPRYIHNYITADRSHFIIKIRSLTTIENTENVWDITTPTGDFIAEGVLVHNSDITDYVMKTYPEQDWFLLNLPAKYDPTRTFISPIGFNDRRKVRNQLLDPVRLPDHFLVTQSKNPIIYNTRYQQNPTASADGNLVKNEWIQESANRPISFSVIITVWDLNITETPESDYTVGLVIGKYEDQYHVIDMWRKQVDIPQQVDAIKKMHKKYKKAIVGVEARANGHAAMSLLKREIPDIYAFEPRKFGGKKEARLGSVLPYFRDKKVFIYNPFIEDNKLEVTYSADQIIKELKGFPLVSTDDIIDCLSYGIAYLAEYGQENTAVITNGNKITVFDEDYIEEKLAEKISRTNMLTYEFSQESIPTRSFIQDIDW